MWGRAHDRAFWEGLCIGLRTCDARKPEITTLLRRLFSMPRFCVFSRRDKAHPVGCWAVLDAIITLWEEQDPKFLRALALFRELLERDRQQKQVA